MSDGGPSAVRVGVSSCLLGEEVRYDGGHKHRPFLTDVLGDRVRWIPVCPELDIGLGVPREAIHLLAGPGDVRLVGVRSGTDHSAVMRTYAERRVAQLERAGLDGYVLKSRSPSCGLDGVPLHDPDSGAVIGHDRGRFAAALLERCPDLPVVEEDQLEAPDVRDRFLERACVRHRWRNGPGDDPAAALAGFHARHEMQVLAHSPAAHQELGAIVSRLGDDGPQGPSGAYRRVLHGALDQPTTRERHVHVMERLVAMLAGPDPQLRDAIDAYASGATSWPQVAGGLRTLAPQAPPRFASQTYLDPLAEVGMAPTSW